MGSLHDFFHNLIAPTGNHRNFLWGGDFWRNLFDEGADVSRSENEFSGVFNHRTGRYDNGADPAGVYDHED